MNYSVLAQWCKQPLPQFLKFKAIEKAGDQFRIVFIKTDLFLQINLCSNDGFCFFSQDDSLQFFPTFSGVNNLFKNAVLTKMSVLGDDRVLSFCFHKNSIYGESLLLKIVVELIPGKQNIIFLQEDKVVFAKKQFSFADNPQRQILAGQKYLLPHHQNKQKFCASPLPWHDGDYSFDSVNGYLEHRFYNHIHLKRLAISKEREQNRRQRQIQKAEENLAKLKGVLLDYSKLDYWKMAGELLKSAHQHITPGMQEITLTNYFDPQMKKVVVKLKKGLSPSQNIAFYFKKYKKAVMGKEIIQERVTLKQSQIKRLKSELSLDPPLQKLTKPKPKTNAKKSLKQIKIDENFKILIGRNDAENNQITCKLAGKNDLWFHTRAIRGSHVVIFNPHQREIPRDVLEIAAGLAAYYSKAKHSGKVAVDYTQIRYVWKIRKGRLGQVNYKNQKTVFVQPKSMRQVKKELLARQKPT